MKKTFLLLVVIQLFVFSCKNESKDNSAEQLNRGLIAKKAMVVSARKEASKIGSDLLEKGGNAFDAMMATEMALAVAYPYAGNLGGGGFMIYRLEDGSIGSLDYREKAPLAASKDMYLDNDGNVIPNKSTVGGMAIGIPGTVSGIFKRCAPTGYRLSEKWVHYYRKATTTLFRLQYYFY
jgi:gamma-glutamyltranspeptidase/glutathione hydrolase